MIFRGLKIPKTQDLLLGKIMGLVLFNVDWTFFVSNVLQEFFYKADALALFCSENPPNLLNLGLIKEIQRWKGLWKCNNSIV